MTLVDHQQTRLLRRRYKCRSSFLGFRTAIHNEHECSESLMEVLSVIYRPVIEKAVSCISRTKDQVVISGTMESDRYGYSPVYIEHARSPGVPDQLHRTGEGSRAKYAGFLRGFYERAARNSRFDFPLDRTEARSPSGRETLARRGRPRSHQAGHSLPAATDAAEVVRVFDHQLNRLIPKIFGHRVPSYLSLEKESRNWHSRSWILSHWAKVRGLDGTKGPEAP